MHHKHYDHRHTRTRTALVACAVVGFVAVVACDPPTHPRNFSQTVIRNLCHFEYACCTPSERLAGAGFSLAPDEGACVEEFTDSFGGIFAAAAEAVDRGVATYDAEAAERCTAERRAAVESCDSQALAGTSGISSTAVIFMIDERDAECAALANRSFTRGTVKGGDDCLSDFDCADFGRCFDDDDDGDDDLSVGGTCHPLAKAGDSCTDEGFAGCQPGLVCDDDAKCAAPTPADDGAACVANAGCKSGLCQLGASGSCAVGGASCDFDDECPDACIDGLCSDGGACTEDFDCFGSACVLPDAVCAAAPKVTIEICDGL